MRIGELLRSEVVASDGCRLGRVHDVRLVRDGPALGRFGPALRVDGLLVGRGSIAVRLGYHRSEVTGPFLVGRLFGALAGRATFVPWDQVAGVQGGEVRLACTADDLPLVPDVG